MIMEQRMLWMKAVRKRLLAFGGAALLAAALGGCGWNRDRTVLELIHEDAEGDGRSVMWDGEKAGRGPDELDAPGLLDGRAGMRSAVFYDAEVGVQLTLAGEDNLLASLDTVISDSAEAFIAESPTRFLSVCRQQEGAAAEKTDADERSMREEAVNVPGMEKLQKLETGLYLTEGERVMIGFSTCCRNSNGELCRVVYAGIGNYSDIRMEAGTLMKRLNSIGLMKKGGGHD